MKRPRSAVDEAIEWTACMRSGEVQADEQKAFDAWFANPTNAQAWEKVQRHLGTTFSPLVRGSDSKVRQVLQAPDLQRRRLLRGALVLGGVGFGATWVGQQSTLFTRIGADLHTATAQRRDFNLSDGSQLLLDARSAVDINFTEKERHLVLRAGKLVIEVSDDPRPFVVQTPHGFARAEAARFMVSLQGDSTHVWGMRSSLCIARPNALCSVLQSGAGARLDAKGVTPLAANHKGESSWESGKLSVDDWSLGEVIEALQPYQRGVLRISPVAARLRVSGLFSLDNSERALASLAQILPVRIEQYLGFWTQIEMRG
ncbi:FecR domain-containing protein [Pseudomonas kilonensis]|uniref:FecR domain-containing protein n=1 Tax=Pseudomonas kilonensis TaxID=132476 RepID=UPI000409037A|nr:FecR domain-containing protein [Pseudomonas kilonensis]